MTDHRPSPSLRGEDIRAVHRALRDHELELNRATAAFEHAVIAPLTVVNGGAAAAWLAFLGGEEVAPGGQWAALFWGAGLLAAIAASFLGWRRQRAYSTAERLRREAWELLWLRPEEPEWAYLRQVVSQVAYEKRTWEAATHEWQRTLRKAHESIDKGQGFSLWFQTTVWVSALAFVAGAVWAAAALVSGSA